MRRLALLFSVLILAPQISAHEALPKETLKKLIPSAQNFVNRQKALSPQQVAAVETKIQQELGDEDRTLTVYVAVDKDPQTGRSRSIGGVLMVDAKGPKGWVDLAMACDLKGAVQSVVVVKNEDDKALEAPEFLSQFEGLGPSDNWDVDRFKSAGSPEGSRAVIEAVQRGVHLFSAFMGR